MSRLLYIGGFGNGKSTADSAADALAAGFSCEEADAFTFSEALEYPSEIRKASKHSKIATHSAGLLAVADALHGSNLPDEILAFAPPVPSSRLKLAGAFLIKTGRLFTPSIGIKSLSDVVDVAKYHASGTAELAAHPVANLSQIKAVSKFDSTKFAAEANAHNVPTSLAFMENDSFFQPTAEQLEKAENLGTAIKILPGEHDELPIRPQTTVLNYLARPIGWRLTRP